MWFFDVSGNNSLSISRVCWWFSRSKSDDHLWVYPSTSKTWRCGRSYFPQRRKPSPFDAAVCPRNFNWIRLSRKLQDILLKCSSSSACITRWRYHWLANNEEWIWTSRVEAIGMWLLERPVRSWIMIFQGMILKYIECRKCVKSSESCVWREDLARVLVRVRAVLLELDRYEKPNIGWKFSFIYYFGCVWNRVPVVENKLLRWLYRPYIT